MIEIVHQNSIPVSFGDCDPAGIVYYPNHFRWFDATFHALLHRWGGGHGAICGELGSIGLGLIDVGGTFRSPAADGDRLDLVARLVEWNARTFKLAYEGRIGERLVVQGFELRGVFIRDGERLRAGEVAPLRAILEAGAARAAS
ncbi:MAG: acyl-CoA thioesterase [Mesorhizobium sp.]